MGWIVSAAAVAASLFVLWIATLLSRRWYVTLRKSEETELVNLYLARIAEALERLASAPRELHMQPAPEASASKPVGPMGMSMLGL
jgi:C4-dicarboxylate-specific signal transduction histidine kinase